MRDMVGKKDVARQAVRAALESWSHEPPPSFGRRRFDDVPPPSRGVQTDLSTTVFSAEPEDWVRYLSLGDARYEPEQKVRVHLHRDWRLAAFEPENEGSRWLSELLDHGLRLVRQRLEASPRALSVLDDLVFGDTTATGRTVIVLLSPHLPSDGARESSLEDPQGHGEARVVLHTRLVRFVQDALDTRAGVGPERRVGLFWPVVSRLLSELAYPTAPLDRFAAKIDVFAKLTFVTLHVLYEAKKSGRLVKSPAGEIYTDMISESSGIARDRLEDEHPYFRMLSGLGFLLRGDSYASYAVEAQIAAREYLDHSYLRLSLAGAMPDVPEAMRPMEFERLGRKVRTPKPVLGQFGVHDQDDLDSWKQVDGPFRDLGFTLLRQLGMGEFGRVYEVLNDHNPRHPARVALKVDRIQGKKKQAILEAEQAMTVGRDLARAHHLIRLYDTGKLRGERYTYHVLQLIDGDTLDNLVGVTGSEHASVSRPPRARATEQEAEREYRRAVGLPGSQLWRRRRVALPFVRQLSPTMLLDLLSSVLLWIDSVHDVRYAINDLKNGNLMMSRRGQLKGIDLDSYAPVHTPKDKITDFMFLAVSLVMLLLSAKHGNDIHKVPWEELIENEGRLREGIVNAWPFGDVEASSEGRVTEGELLDTLVDLVQRSRKLSYVKHPEVFKQDLVRLISIKRRLRPEEMVID